MARTNKTAQTQTAAQQLGSIVKSSRNIMRKDKGLFKPKPPENWTPCCRRC